MRPDQPTIQRIAFSMLLQDWTRVSWRSLPNARSITCDSVRWARKRLMRKHAKTSLSLRGMLHKEESNPDAEVRSIGPYRPVQQHFQRLLCRQ